MCVSTCSGTLVHQVILPSADIDRSASTYSTRASLRHYHIIKDKHSAACVIIPVRPWYICGMQSILCFVYKLACTGKRFFMNFLHFSVSDKKRARQWGSVAVEHFAFTKSRIKNRKIKRVPGISRHPDYRHWIRNPILARNGFDSPPVNTSRVLRGRLQPLPGIDMEAEKKSTTVILQPLSDVIINMTSSVSWWCFEKINSAW